MTSEAHAASVHDLGSLSDGELDQLEAQVRGVAGAAEGLSEMLDALVEEVREARHTRGSVPLELPSTLSADPVDVILDQRDAMARAVELREDPALSPTIRGVWAVVVERLALARREAKDSLAERRRNDPEAGDLMVAELKAEETARAHERDSVDRSVPGGDESR